MVSTGVDISTFRQTLSAFSLHRIKHIVEGHDAASRRTAADGLSSASTHDSTSDEVCDIFSKPSASSLHLIKHIRTGVHATL